MRVRPDWTPLGLAIGHASDEQGATGVTVVRGLRGHYRAAVAVTGRATGARELDTLNPHHVADRCDAIMLAGGSAFGLDAAAGVMRWLEERGRGFVVGGGAVVPIVPAAVVFDFFPLGDGEARPTPEMAYEACESASPFDVAEGSVGAGTGTTVGKAFGIAHCMKGGVGCWQESEGEVTVGAITVVNALGDVRDGDGQIIAGARDTHGGFMDAARGLRAAVADADFASLAAHNTTLSVVATNATMSRVALSRFASAAAMALSRRITPAGTSFDGDITFAVCPLEGPTAPVLPLEALATHTLEMAIERAVRTARGRDGVAGLADEGDR